MDSRQHNRDSTKVDIGPDYVELDDSTSWRPLSHDDQDTSYNPGASSDSSTNPLEEQLPLGKAIKRYPKVAGYCLAMTVAIIGWGYDLVITGSITGVDSFKNDYGQEHKGKQIIPSFWLSMWLALPAAGGAAGSVVGGWMQDKIGRKFSLMAGSVISAISVALIFFSFLPPTENSRRMMLTAGLTVQGFSVGVIKTTCLTYISENAPTALRGPAMALFPIFTLLGQLIGSIVAFVVNGVEGAVGYQAAFASMWALAVAPFILSCVMPDSPAYLIRSGQEARAIGSAKRLFAPKVNAHVVLEKVRSTIEEEKASATSATYWDCFKGTNLRRTMIAILANIIPALFGLDLLSNAPVFLQSFGMASGPSLLLMIAGVVAGMFANAGGMWIMSRVGRRNMTLISMGAAGLLWGGMGISGFWTGDVAVWIAGGLMITIIVVCGLGCWPAGYAIMGEVSSLQLRAPTQGVGGVAAQGSSIAMSVVLPYIFNPDSADLGAKTGFLYFGLCAVGVGLTWLWVPEMKGRSLMELDQMFQMKLSTRKFKQWKGSNYLPQEASPLAESHE
ncbi:general substrate transporter [Thelonectria olida]|uniref:General substrate transporter n=1 Tax=Thelonectria olida TaxID=1576542 RepID=A0A9P8W2T7_9HYPO|nr:general substrate transporter [Thelonectria olida]